MEARACAELAHVKDTVDSLCELTLRVAVVSRWFMAWFLRVCDVAVVKEAFIFASNRRVLAVPTALPPAVLLRHPPSPAFCLWFLITPINQR